MASKAFHKGKYFITFKRGYEDCRRDVTLSIDKVFENDTLRLSLSDEDDPMFLYLLNVTRLDYEDLKKHQGLLVDFENFPSQLVRLLQQCASNNMFLILQQSSPVQFYLEVVEHNEFKRLVHLSLKTSPATDSELKQHMVDNIKNLKKTLSSVKSSAMSNEALLNDKCFNMERKIHDLSHVLSKLEEEKLKCEIEFKDRLKQEQDRMMEEKLTWQKNMDYNMKTKLSTYQDNMDRKDKQIDELNSLCKQLRDNIMHLENQLSEKSKCLSLLEKEVQKSHIEVATLKAKNASLEKDVMERDKEYNHLNSKYMYLEKTLKDNSDVIKDLNNTLQTIKKEKTNLEERLAISESLVNKNNEAVHSTSEQLLKANQIISKQNADLIEMKEKLLCRTAIALEQEKVIERNTKEMDELKLKMSATNENMDKLQKKFDDLMEKYENIEKTLKEREDTIKNNNMVIQWLHKKMECSPPTETTINTHHKNGIQSSSSTPYFISRKNNYQGDTSHAISDESIDFYATSKLRSNLEESPGPEGLNKAKLGLDPKYLQTADSDNKVASATGTKLKPNSISSSKGKENFNTNLPKVDYREKKSARASYRATPVSAYFP